MEAIKNQGVSKRNVLRYDLKLPRLEFKSRFEAELDPDVAEEKVHYFNSVSLYLPVYNTLG